MSIIQYGSIAAYLHILFKGERKACVGRKSQIIFILILNNTC